MSGNDEQPSVDEGVRKLREDVNTVLEMLHRVEMPLNNTYSLEFLAAIAILGGVKGSRIWTRAVARVVKERLEEIEFVIKEDDR